MAVTINGSTGITTNGISDTTGTDALNNVTVAGTLAVTGTSSHTGNATFAGTVAVTGAITGSSTVAGATGTLYPLVSGTAQASTSGTSITFTGIPSWVKRITVMFNGVSTNGTSFKQIQLGSGSVQITGYTSSSTVTGTTSSTSTSTSGMIIGNAIASDTIYGIMVIANVSGNIWVSNHSNYSNSTPQSTFGGGGVTLSGALDRVVLTTINGTDTFDAGSINILYE